MPWLRNAHRHTKTRWTLTVLAGVFLIAAIAGGWYAKRWEIGKGTTLTTYGGNVAFVVQWSEHFYVEPMTGDKWIDRTPRWNWSLDVTWYRQNLIMVRCSFMPLAMACAVAAAWLWYRRRRPFGRPNRPDRHGQWRRTRWSLTILTLTMAATALVGESWTLTRVWPLSFCGVGYNASVWWWTDYRAASYERLAEDWSLKPNEPLSVSGSAATDPLMVRPFCVEFGDSDYVGFWVSLWFLTFLLAALSGLLWLIHLRRHPVGCCTQCRYDLTGLAAGTPCPECGKSSATA